MDTLELGTVDYEKFERAVKSVWPTVPQKKLRVMWRDCRSSVGIGGVDDKEIDYRLFLEKMEASNRHWSDRLLSSEATSEAVQEEGVAREEVRTYIRRRMQEDQGLQQALERIREYLYKKRKSIKDAFREWDGNGNGLISIAELREGIEKMNVRIDPKHIELILKYADEDDSGAIDYVEFAQKFEMRVVNEFEKPFGPGPPQRPAVSSVITPNLRASQRFHDFSQRVTRYSCSPRKLAGDTNYLTVPAESSPSHISEKDRFRKWNRVGQGPDSSNIGQEMKQQKMQADERRLQGTREVNEWIQSRYALRGLEHQKMWEKDQARVASITKQQQRYFKAVHRMNLQGGGL
eukprot:GILI01009342.1.p1 GENE.GILI01009342.1~~GILI01009342.1.p1  ORF type:complete len:348 (-),score=70.96 GILI01009342.1:196-1239(-)